MQNRDVKAVLFGALFFSAFLILPNPAHAATEVGGMLTESTTWTMANSPYIVRADYFAHEWWTGCGEGYGLSLGTGVVLTIQPGVVVKFDVGTKFLSCQGQLIANGTAALPITFTANTDTPIPEYWQSMKLGPLDQVQHTHISYGSSCITYASSSTIFKFNTVEYCGAALYFEAVRVPLIIEDNILQNSGYGIFMILSEGATISNNHFENNTGYGISINRPFSASTIENNEINGNWVGISFDYQDNSRISNNNITGNSLYGVLSRNTLNAQDNWWGDPTGPYNVTFNPGGLGNEVSNEVDFEPWLSEAVIFDEVGIQRPVIIIPGILGSAQKNGEWIIDPILHTYDNLIDTLEANGYVEDVTLFTFPYNWYQSNVLTAFELKNKINDVQDICDCARVDLIAHSMGGLVARQYIQSNYYENDVKQLIFLGTPHEGSPKAYLTWEGGKISSDANGSLVNFIFSREAKKLGYNDVFDYIRNSPISSVKELLPIYPYLIDKATGTYKPFPSGHPINDFLLNLQASLQNLYNSNVVLTNITGLVNPTSTINDFRVVNSSDLFLWQHGYPEGFFENIGDRGLIFGPGDGTVPEESSTTIQSAQFELAYSHNQIPAKGAGLIFKVLTGVTPTQVFDEFTGFGFELLIFKMLSPADMQVIGPDGKKIGKNFNNNEEFDEIPNAFYSGFETDDEYITIFNPLEGEYKAITQGTNNGGSYTIATGLISDESIIENEFTAQTTPGQIQNISITLSAGEIEVAPEDFIAPHILINSPQLKDYLRSETLPIDVVFSDKESGVFSTSLNLDNISAGNNSSIDLFFQPLGNHIFTAEAVDFLNNTAHQEVEFRVIASPDSTILDVERAYSLGWITKKAVKEDLIRKLKNAIRLEKRIDFLEEQFLDKPKIVKRIERIENRIDKVLARAIIRDLENQRNRNINDQAYFLLLEDINWLINN